MNLVQSVLIYPDYVPTSFPKNKKYKKNIHRRAKHHSKFPKNNLHPFLHPSLSLFHAEYPH